MPEYEQVDRNSVFRTTVHFRSSDDADAFFRLLDRPRKSSFWWPESDGHQGSNVAEQYVTDEG